MYIYGNGGHGHVIFEIAELLGINVEGFIDDYNLFNDLNIPVIRSLSIEGFDCVIGIGNNLIRKKVVQKLPKVSYSVLCHPKSIISKRVKLGEGTVVIAGSVINYNVTVGSHVIINTNSSIDHDCTIEDFAHISPNVALAGGVHVGEGTNIGIGACVIPEVKIGKWVTVGAGSVVIQNVPDFSVLVGNPARIIKYNEYDK